MRLSLEPLARRWAARLERGAELDAELAAKLAAKLAPAVAEILQSETGMDPDVQGFLKLATQYTLV